MATGTIHNTCRVLKSNDCRITCDYATHQKRQKYRQHIFGCDMVTTRYTTCDIVAHTDGRVVRVIDYIQGHEVDKTGCGFGNQVIVEHQNKVLTVYSHLAYGTVRVAVGDVVKAGQTLGVMGNTGSSQGAHLDLSVIKMIGSYTFNNSINLVLDLDKKFRSYNPENYLETILPDQPTNEGLVITHPDYTGSNYYRVRNSWVGGTQKGAYHEYIKAEQCAKKYSGYKVFDKDGVQLYPTIVGDTYDYPTDSGKYYRVRLSWTASSTQKGAFTSFSKAVDCAKQYNGYSVYDNNGIEVY